MKKHSKSLKAFTTIALFSVLVVMLFVVASSSVGATAASDAAVANNTVNDELNETAVYIIQLADAPVASYRGGVDGYAATNPSANGESDLRKSESTLAYAGYLEGVQSAFAQTLVETLDRPVVVKDTFQYAFNGLAVEMTAREASVVAKLDGVTLVQREQLEEVLTDVGPAWIGAASVWDGSASGVATKGEGIVVAILDTGINSTHPSFADIGGDGYDHTNPLGSGVYLGVCDPTNPDYQPAFDCNDKLIGVHDFIDGDGNDPNSPEDGDGHGSHTASTVAGNVVTATLYAPTTELTRTISGVAPHANIIAYDVCRNGESSQGGGCPGAALLAAAEQVVVDHMDLLDAGHPTGIATINYSISGGNNPYYDAVELAFLAATDAGVFVSASAGNSGPTAGTVAHLSPWVGTIAASTHNRALLNNLTDMTSDGAALADITGKSFTAGYGPASIVYAGDYPNANDPGGDPGQCMQPYPAGTFNGEIVICDRGTIARVDKGANVLAGGAGGLVLANAAANGDSLNGDAHYLPAVHITYDDGVVLKAWVDANTNTVATISGTIVDLSTSNGDIMASFSSRGPAGALDVLKPDITAPGVDIWAAVSNDGDAIPDYGFLSGTSMSSPHNAGAVALMTAVHPDWSPQQIKSAMMSTSVNTGLYKEDGATPADPFDLGAGRVDLSMASQAALVLDETTANFTAANPVTGGDPTSLNIPSMSNNECQGSCTWTRTVQSTAAYTTTWNAALSGAADINWSVTPETFTLVPGATQTLTITAEVSGAVSGEWYFGELMLTYDAPVVPTSYDLYLPIIVNAAGSLQAPAQSNAPVQVQAIPDAHFPIAVKPYAPPVIAVDPTSLSSSLDTGATETQPITVTNEGGSDLTWSVFEGLSAPELVDWSDNFDSYTTGSQIAGQGGWEGWGGDPGAGAIVTDTVSLSSPNSVEITGPSDLVHQYSSTAGWWTYTANVYVPSDFAGNSYFILLNSYGGTNNWSVQANFDSASGLLVNDGASGGTTPYLTDQWVEIRIEIDLLNDTQEFYYNNVLLYSGTWSAEVSGGGALSIAAVDLYANGASPIYYDDLSLIETIPQVCDVAGNYPWLSVTPSGGTTAAGASSIANVTFDATGLTNGSYTGTLCFTSNDPETPLVEVPVDLTVTGNPPLIVVDPLELSSSQIPDTQVTQTLTISNTGGADLDWTIDEAAVGSAPDVILYDNGTLVNSPGTGAGGADESVLQSTSLTMNTLGFGHQVSAGNWMADDFTVTDADGWTIDAMTFYAYQTGSTTASTITNINWTIYDGDPGAGGSAIASGSGLQTSVWSNIYRVTETTSGGTTRPIMESTVNTNGIYLPAGTYWVAWQADGTLSSGPWAPPITINGQTTTGNGLQFTATNGVWAPANDTGTNTQQGLPFVLEGSVGNTSSCSTPSDLTWLSVSPTSGTTVPDSSSAVEVTYDSTGLAPATYSGMLCVNSNDATRSLVQVPVSLTVIDTSPSLVLNGAAVAFESGIPFDWSTEVITGNVYWSTTADSTACGNGVNNTPGSGFAACADADQTNSSGDPYDAYLISNAVDLTGTTSITLTFAAGYNDIAAGGDTFEVDVWDGMSWTNVLTWDEDHAEFVNLNLDTYAGSVIQVRFRYAGGDWDWYAHVDDVSLTGN